MDRADAQRAIVEADKSLAQYYHPACDTVTHVPQKIVAAIALEPWHFPLYRTDCNGCGEAPTKEVLLQDQGTLFDAFKQMRRFVPLGGLAARFLGIPLTLIGGDLQERIEPSVGLAHEAGAGGGHLGGNHHFYGFCSQGILMAR